MHFPLTALVAEDTDCFSLQRLPAARGSDGNSETLTVTLRDAVLGMEADLVYTVYPDSDVLARRIVYRNASDSALELRSAASATFDLPAASRELLSLNGGWAAERHPVSVLPYRRCICLRANASTPSYSSPLLPTLPYPSRPLLYLLLSTPAYSYAYSSTYSALLLPLLLLQVCRRLAQGRHVLESRRGISSHQSNPFIAISTDGMNEQHGEVFGFMLGKDTIDKGGHAGGRSVVEPHCAV